MLSRRDFLASGLAIGALPLVPRAQTPAANPVFRHGVASGDPLSDRVVLWTRVTPPPGQTGLVDVEWLIARDPRVSASRAVARGWIRTSAAHDFTAKVDVAGLEPASTYYYRFNAARAESPVGRTRTLPVKTTPRVRLALASCANHPFGYFNVYARIAARSDLDAVIHLGDYIYEYANNNYGNRPGGDGTPFGRIPAPNRELLLLDDYRARYAQYREDEDLQAAHRQHPFIVVWDDHEISNNAWSGGAQNHNAGEGDWQVRRSAAEQAWREWMPVREIDSDSSRIYRQFTFGDLADLVMLDTRLVGRDEQAAAGTDVATVERASRQLLGARQEQWLFDTLRASTRAMRPWQILGQQVMFAPQSPAGQPAGNVDSWDGYRGARNRVFDAATNALVRHLVVFTGDVHSSWAYELARDPFNVTAYDSQTGRGCIGTEIVTPAVTSPSSIPPERLQSLLSARPHLKFVEVAHRGYVVVDITRDRLQADWWFVPTVTERTSAETPAKSFVTEVARPHLVEVSRPATPAS